MVSVYPPAPSGWAVRHTSDPIPVFALAASPVRNNPRPTWCSFPHRSLSLLCPLILPVNVAQVILSAVIFSSLSLAPSRGRPWGSMCEVNPSSDHFSPSSPLLPQFEVPPLSAWSAPDRSPRCLSTWQLEPSLALSISQIISLWGLKPFRCCVAHSWQNLSFR